MNKISLQTGLAGALLLMSGFAWSGDVKLYDKAPSVEELQRQLTGGDGGEVRKPRTRAIVFGDSTPAESEAPAAQPAAAAPRPQARPQTAQTAQPAESYSPPPAPAPAPAQASDRAIAFPINFSVNSSNILPESVPFLESIAGLMQKDTSMRLIVEGHTDKSGPAARNAVLSRERAYSVTNYLIDHYRIDPMRLMPVGKGFSEPLPGMEPTNPKNRRVQFRIGG